MAWFALFLIPGVAGAQPTQVADRQNRFAKNIVEMESLQIEMTFQQFLDRFLKLSGTSVRIDPDAWKSQIASIKESRLTMPEYPPRFQSYTALRLAISKVIFPEDVELLWTKKGIVLTTPKRAVIDRSYDVQPGLAGFAKSARLRKLREDVPHDVAMAQWIANAAALRPFESLKIVNGTTLVVHAADSKQENVEQLLVALQREHDISIVTEARLYQVDRAFFDQNIAPLLRRPKDGFPLPANVVSSDEAKLKKLKKQKLVLQSKKQIDPEISAAILSWHESFARWDEKKEIKPKVHKQKIGDLVIEDEVGFPQTGIRFPNQNDRLAMAGVAFNAKVSIDGTRRFMNVHLTRTIDQPSKRTKLRFREMDLGFEEAEFGKDESTATSFSFLLPDGGSFMMPATFRMPTNGNESRMHVLIATMRIRIEEEEREIERQNQTKTK